MNSLDMFNEVNLYRELEKMTRDSDDAASVYLRLMSAMCLTGVKSDAYEKIGNLLIRRIMGQLIEFADGPDGDGEESLQLLDSTIRLFQDLCKGKSDADD